MERFEVDARPGATIVEHDGQPPGEEQVEVAARQTQGACLAGREPLGVLVSEERVEPTLFSGGDGRARADERLALGNGEEGDPGDERRGEQHHDEHDQSPAPGVPPAPPAEARGYADRTAYGGKDE